MQAVPAAMLAGDLQPIGEVSRNNERRKPSFNLGNNRTGRALLCQFGLRAGGTYRAFKAFEHANRSSDNLVSIPTGEVLRTAVSRSDNAVKP